MTWFRACSQVIWKCKIKSNVRDSMIKIEFRAILPPRRVIKIDWIENIVSAMSHSCFAEREFHRDAARLIFSSFVRHQRIVATRAETNYIPSKATHLLIRIYRELVTVVASVVAESKLSKANGWPTTVKVEGKQWAAVATRSNWTPSSIHPHSHAQKHTAQRHEERNRNSPAISPLGSRSSSWFSINGGPTAIYTRDQSRISPVLSPTRHVREPQNEKKINRAL